MELVVREGQQIHPVCATALFLYGALIVDLDLFRELELEVRPRWHITAWYDSESVRDGELADS